MKFYEESNNLKTVVKIYCYASIFLQLNSVSTYNILIISNFSIVFVYELM